MNKYPNIRSSPRCMHTPLVVVGLMAEVGCHVLLCRSLLLSTTVLNENEDDYLRKKKKTSDN